MLLESLIPHANARLQRGSPLTGAQWAALWSDAAREAAGSDLSDEQVEPALCRELWQLSARLRSQTYVFVTR